MKERTEVRQVGQDIFCHVRGTFPKKKDPYHILIKVVYSYCPLYFVLIIFAHVTPSHINIPLNRYIFKSSMIFQIFRMFLSVLKLGRLTTYGMK